MAKIYVATPAYGGNCSINYVQSLLGLQNEIILNGHQFAYGIVSNESLITRARNNLVYEFLKTDYDYLLFIDSDHRFNPNDILKMIDFDLDIICAVPPKKVIDWESVKQAVSLDKNSLEFYTGDFVLNPIDKDNEIFPNRPFEIKHGGTGIMLIKRKVFEKMANHVNKYISNNSKDDYVQNKIINEFFYTEVENEVLLSEDYAFCKKWRELGGKVYAAPWVGVTHIGTYEFSGSFLAKLDMMYELSKINNN